MYDMIILGGGTAGLTAAIYGKRAGKQVLLLEKAVCGGQIISSQEIENYPGLKSVSGADFAEAIQRQAEELGTEIRYEEVLAIRDLGEVKTVVTEQDAYPCKTVIVATGAKNRPLGLPGERELTGAGISYCATCDGAFFRGKTVAVAGGGNTALEDAIFLSAYCERVFVIHRRDTFRGEQRLVRRLEQKENVEFLMDTVIEGLLGEQCLSGLLLKEKHSGASRELSVQGLFVAVGQQPENEVVKELLELDAHGYLVAGEDCTTSAAGIFAAGDVRTKGVRQLSTAAADGTVAALAACAYLESMV